MTTKSLPEFELFTSLRYDSILASCPANTVLANQPCACYMLRLHRDRILEAAHNFSWDAVIAILSGPGSLQGLCKLIEANTDPKSPTPLRVRVAVDRDGNVSVTSGPTPVRQLGNLYPSFLPDPDSKDEDSSQERLVPSRADSWVVMPDTQLTTPSPFSMYKTSRREIYDSARERVGITSMAEPKEVLLISTNDGEIMEGSLTSIILWRGGRWVTPPVSSGGQAGTTRRWLIKEGLIEEEVVRVGSLRDGEECWLSNGVRGLIYGRIKFGGHSKREERKDGYQ